MDNRKVIKFGKTSFVVSLPIKWLRSCNLDKGDLLDVKEKHSSLLISPAYKEDCTREHTIILDDDIGFVPLMNRIKSAYLSNYDMIKVQGSIKEHMPNITKALNGFNNLDMINVSDNQVILKDFIDKKYAKSNDVFLKMNSVIINMFSSLINNKDASEISELDLELNKLNSFLNKLIHHDIDNFKDNTEKLMIVIKMSNYLELIGDEIKRIAKLDKKNMLDNLIVKDVIDFYKNGFNQSLKLLDKRLVDIKPLLDKKESLSNSLDKYYEITDSKVVGAAIQRLKNIIEFSHIVFMSAHVYALM